MSQVGVVFLLCVTPLQVVDIVSAAGIQIHVEAAILDTVHSMLRMVEDIQGAIHKVKSTPRPMGVRRLDWGFGSRGEDSPDGGISGGKVSTSSPGSLPRGAGDVLGGGGTPPRVPLLHLPGGPTPSVGSHANPGMGGGSYPRPSRRVSRSISSVDDLLSEDRAPLPATEVAEMETQPSFALSLNLSQVLVSTSLSPPPEGAEPASAAVSAGAASSSSSSGSPKGKKQYQHRSGKKKLRTRRDSASHAAELELRKRHSLLVIIDVGISATIFHSGVNGEVPIVVLGVRNCSITSREWSQHNPPPKSAFSSSLDKEGMF